MNKTYPFRGDLITSSMKHTSIFAILSLGMASAVTEENIEFPLHDINPEAGIYDFGDKVLDGSSGTHDGFDLIMSGTEGESLIEGYIEATVGAASGSTANYFSWEILRIDGMPSEETYYDWKLDVDVSITSADNVTADPNLYSDTTYGIILHNFSAGESKYNHIKEVAGSVTVTDYQGLAAGSGKPAEALQGTVYGVEVGAYYDIETLSSEVKMTNASSGVGYQFNTGTRIGVDSDGNAIEGAGITGKITMHNVDEAVGILYSGTGDNNSSADEPRVGYNSADITITSSADHAVKAAVGLYVNGEGVNNEIQGALTGIFNGNIDIDVTYDKEALGATENAIVAGVQIIQKEEYVEDLEHIVFGDGASISAKYTIEGDASGQVHYGDAINLMASQNNDQLNLTTVNDTDTVTLEGNIRAFHNNNGVRDTQDLTFEQGVYNVSADTFEASSITLGSYDTATKVMKDATLNLHDSLAVEHVEHVDFYLQSYGVGEYSSINIAAGETLTLASAENINIYLGADLMEYSQYSFDLIAGDVTGLEGITFSVFNGTLEGEGALLWDFELNGEYGIYQSISTVTTHYFEVHYSEDGVKLVARIPNIPDGPQIPEPSTATLSLIALAGLMARRRRKA